ncbi:hypothetical protein LCGC14_0413100 [marine sediment metagenome]|uniref:Uncharacterized protein n=1 Tax=marine sediment metagenome TaxID=412755 RepID=A0A0F9W266_9ZZZZ
MSSSEIVCPSGLKGEIRGLKTKDANMLAASQSTRMRVGVLNKLLGSCWQNTLDPGPYTLDADGAPNWNQVLQGDRQFLLLQVRCKSYGPDYEFKIQCDEVSCRERFSWGLDLNDIPVKRLPAESFERFKNGNRFDAELPSDGRKIVFQLPTGGDEVSAAKLKSQFRDRLITLALNIRIVEVEDVEERELRRFFDEMELSDANALLDILDEPDCGVETEIEIECPECYGVQDVRLPFDRDFFFPRKKQRKGAAKLRAI